MPQSAERDVLSRVALPMPVARGHRERIPKVAPHRGSVGRPPSALPRPERIRPAVGLMIEGEIDAAVCHGGMRITDVVRRLFARIATGKDAST